MPPHPNGSVAGAEAGGCNALEYPVSPSLRNLTDGSLHTVAEAPNAPLQSLGAPHVQSFNFMLEEGLAMAVADIEPVSFRIPETDDLVCLRIKDFRIENPKCPPEAQVVEPRVFPTEARQRGTTYKARSVLRFSYSVNDIERAPIEKDMGRIPIMVKSNACNLKGLSPKELLLHGEHENEWGGYFVVGGHERIIRMLQTPRRNYPFAMQRPSWTQRGKNFSDLGIAIECGKRDLTTVKNVLHFVTTGTAKYMFNIGKELFFVPVVMVLKCLTNRTDAAIYAELVAGVDPEDFYYRGCLRTMLSEPQDEGLFSPEQVRMFLGASFRHRLEQDLAPGLGDADIAEGLMRRAVCVHLDDPEDKFQLIALMVKKLFALVQKKCVVEGVDNIMMQEIVLGGHLYLQLLKDKLAMWLRSLKFAILKKAKMSRTTFALDGRGMDESLRLTPGFEKMFDNFLGTGNLPVTTNGLGLMQDKGLTIMAENINRMRYMSHFRAIHRGSFFQEMRTTEVRALLPDAWGFVCPVHTPDGAPCGLLNHLAMPVEVVAHPPDAGQLPQVLFNLGVLPLAERDADLPCSSYTVVLDGRVLGYVRKREARRLADQLRLLKIKRSEPRVPDTTEIVLICEQKREAQFPGLFIFTGPARMVRPVLNLATRQVEKIGSFEQVFLDISVADKEMYKGVTTHKELRATAFLSNLACTIPLPDFNQSPRNMYQCQMGKQTMATPMHTWHLNSETKMYRLQTPTAPFFRPAHYDYIKMDEFPMGTNAVVAVISYTGYDMEDAMIINKSSYERGFAAGSIYKSTFIDLPQLVTGRKEHAHGAQQKGLYFSRDPKRLTELQEHLDEDGLPYVGRLMRLGNPLYCYYIEAENSYMVKYYENKEECYVDAIKVCSNDMGDRRFNRICISYRVPRNPSVGDKFASRAGQKGICSQKWPTEDLPWTESGLVPDIVFNPHGFPSRMTIAMMIECMAGKSGALNGLCHDATPFQFGEEQGDNSVDAIDYFARQLEMAGYNYYGTETLYSGTDGVEMQAEIFFGIIHYQRLRHMVSDKYQVRSVGALDQITHQPIKGRRRGGGVRFGEMERDSLLSHGSMLLLQDRLFHGSDKARVKICTRCGSLLSPRVVTAKAQDASADSQFTRQTVHCVICDTDAQVHDMFLPYVFLHLVCQLAAVNIKLKIDTTHQ